MMKPLNGTKPILNHPFTRGLELCYLFNERSGTVIYDACLGKPGYLNNFIFSSSTSGWYGSNNGGGLSFDGFNDYVAIGNKLIKFIDYNKPFTISVSIKFNSVSGSIAIMGMAAFRSGNPNLLVLRIDNTGQVTFDLTESTAIGELNGYIWNTASNVVASGKQYNIVVTYDGSNTASGCKIYVNGRSFSTTNNDYGPITGSIYQSGYLLDKDLWIGRRNYNTGDLPLYGIIDQVRFYSRVLQKYEVEMLNAHPFLGFSRGNVTRVQPTSLEWAPHDPFGLLGIHGI